MIEQIKEYLMSDDEGIVGIGFELLVRDTSITSGRKLGILKRLGFQVDYADLLKFSISKRFPYKEPWSGGVGFLNRSDTKTVGILYRDEPLNPYNKTNNDENYRDMDGGLCSHR